MDDAIENGVADRRLADHLMPGWHGKLASDQDGAAAVAIQRGKKLRLVTVFLAACSRRVVARPQNRLSFGPQRMIYVVGVCVVLSVPKIRFWNNGDEVRRGRAQI
jgi:hypothetical protein